MKNTFADALYILRKYRVQFISQKYIRNIHPVSDVILKSRSETRLFALHLHHTSCALFETIIKFLSRTKFSYTQMNRENYAMSF